MTEPGWGSLQFATTDILHIGYYELGRGPVVLLLHGFPYDVHAYIEVAPIVAAAGHRVIVPYLRGFGPTTYRDRSALRSAEQAALASDVIDLLDSLGIPHCVVGGFDWGARGLSRRSALTRALPRLLSAGGPSNARHNLSHERPFAFRSSSGCARPDSTAKVRRPGRHDAARAVAHRSRSHSRLPGLSDGRRADD